MGMNCSCSRNVKESDIPLDEIKIAIYLKYIIKLQAYFRAIFTREKLKTKYSFYNKTLLDSTQSFNTTEEEFNEMLSHYPLSLHFKDDRLIIKLIVENKKKSRYFGEVIINTNLRHGRGIQKWADGSKYEGYWINDKVNIKGKLTHANGDTYEGEWEEEKANGYGVYKHTNGEVYKGRWVNDKQQGKGRETWPDGTVYEGEYLEGMKHGYGVLKCYDGSVYEGDFLLNCLHGQGRYTWFDKREYIGDWVYNKMTGKGVFRWPDGRRYEGKFNNDRKEGYGEHIWPDGRTYKGEWLNGNQHGLGSFYNPATKMWYQGKWDNGKRII